MDRRDKTNYYLDMAQVALERGTCPVSYTHLHHPDQIRFLTAVFLKESVSGFEVKRTAFSVHSS